MRLNYSLAAILLASTAIPGTALAQWKEGDFMVRGRAIYVSPDESNNSLSAVGGKGKVSDEVVPELDFSYFITDNVAVELIAATSKHDAKGKGTALGNIDAGSTWVLPPTLTLQYHITEWAGFKPYVGAGLNYTMYYNEKGGVAGDLKIKDSFGYALQAGVDVPIDDKWSWNFDVKKLFVKADAKWANGTIRSDMDLDPWIIGTGIGYRF